MDVDESRDRKNIGLQASIWANGRHPYGGASSSSHAYFSSSTSSRAVSPLPARSASPSVTTASLAATSATSDGLSNSQVAQEAITSTTTTTTRPATSGGGRLSRSQAFNRFEQACQRLQWKRIELDNAYLRALQDPSESGFSTLVAERNFKVDFHEFYVWIEQAIVLVLLVFGITVLRGQQQQSIPSIAAPGGSGGGGFAGHTYHQNVLKALEDVDNPLHPVLGKGDVMHALWKAKELRNRWKDAAEKDTPPLKMYGVEWIVQTILTGLSEAYRLAAQESSINSEVQVGHVANHIEGSKTDDAGWEWMTEPMDWEA